VYFGKPAIIIAPDNAAEEEAGMARAWPSPAISLRHSFAVIAVIVRVQQVLHRLVRDCLERRF